MATLRRTFLSQTGLALGCVLFAESIRPRRYLADTRGPISLDKDVPKTLPGWVKFDGGQTVLPSPEVTAALARIYTDTLDRTFLDDDGQGVMLSIAYGRDQGNELNAAHRPEYCYRAQGFDLSQESLVSLDLGSTTINAISLLATKPGRTEHITYWLTIGTDIISKNIERKLSQIRYGLHGDIPDGVIFRISSINMNSADALALHNKFLRSLQPATPEPLRSLLFGRQTQ